MFLVRIQYEKGRLREIDVESLGVILQSVAATAHREPDSGDVLTMDDVVVRLESYGPLDINPLPLQIIVSTDDPRVLEASLEERIKKVVGEVIGELVDGENSSAPFRHSVEVQSHPSDFHML